MGQVPTYRPLKEESRINRKNDQSHSHVMLVNTYCIPLGDYTVGGLYRWGIVCVVVWCFLFSTIVNSFV